MVAHSRFAGMKSAALEAARLTEGEEAGMQPGVAGPVCVDCAGVGSPEVVLTMLRFGQFKQIVEQPTPSSWGINAAYNQAAYELARAFALYALGNQSAAEQAAAAARVAAGKDTTYYPVIVPKELDAAKAWFAHDTEGALRALEAAREADDAHNYDEPPRWYYPIRQCIGEVALQVNSTRALEVFQEDLTVFPENGWSLLGASRAAKALGQEGMSAEYFERAQVAWQNADGPLESPCPQLAGWGASSS